MQNNLFLLCPTDCLESVINDTYKDENYFYSSLGNSMITENSALDSIKELIINQNIDNIYVVLSNENQIVLDALGRQLYSETRGLKKFYNDLTSQEKHSKTFWESRHKYSIFSYHLNNKIKELQFEFRNLPVNPIKINGKIYDKQHSKFMAIHLDVICIKQHILN